MAYLAALGVTSAIGEILADRQIQRAVAFDASMRIEAKKVNDKDAKQHPPSIPVNQHQHPVAKGLRIGPGKRTNV